MMGNYMKKLLTSLGMAGALALSAQPVLAQDIEAARAASAAGDYEAALAQLRPLAERGDAEAQTYIGAMYAAGEGVAQDYGEAARLLRLAAEQGFAKAQYNLGVMYATGQGVTQDMVRAYLWFDLAAALGDDNGRRYRDMAAWSLSPAQIAEAKRLATQCQARDYQGC